MTVAKSIALRPATIVTSDVQLGDQRPGAGLISASGGQMLGWSAWARIEPSPSIFWSIDLVSTKTS